MIAEGAIEQLESVKEARVLFIGDAIIDEYHYVTPLGKSPKENLIPVRYEKHEEFNGGTHAAAHHAMSFCDHVDVITLGAVTRKRRFIDKVYLRKLFEVHVSDPQRDEDVNGADAVPFSRYAAVVVTDFGHGAIDAGLIERMRDESGYLAVCAQTNSANVGFNLITRYPAADYICIDEPEARLAASDRHSKIEDVILKLAEGRCSKMIVTHGSMGAVGWDEETGFAYSPAFTDKVVDTMGAGDAFFAITALVAPVATMEELLLIGNAAGALKTQIVGHRESIRKQGLIDFLKGAQR